MPAQVLLNINESLRFVLYGVSVHLRVDLRASEIERLFSDSESGKSDQTYEFHESPRVHVFGSVEEYEPGTVWLSVAARKFEQRDLDYLVDAARHASFGDRPGDLTAHP